MTKTTLETATFAAGCFWCTEAIFKRLNGVESVMSGYSGGDSENPTYEQVSSGKSGHAESIQIKFNPKVISYEKLLEIFLKLHDPTTLNKQGNDIGSQYRSAIFYHNEQQKESAQKSLNKFNTEVYNGKIVTEVSQFISFYPAEDYHQNYYDKNKEAGYCQVVIDPKITKLYKDFSGAVKGEFKK